MPSISEVVWQGSFEGMPTIYGLTATARQKDTDVKIQAPNFCTGVKIVMDKQFCV